MPCNTLFYGLSNNRPRNEHEFVVNTELYTKNYNCQNIVIGWMEDRTSWDLLNGASTEMVFKAFISCWVAFNAWAACVTDHDTDWKWKLCLMKDAGTVEKFRRLLADDTAFAAKARDFSSYWPIFKAQELRKKHVSSQTGSRDEAIKTYHETYDIKDFQPQCFFIHREAGVNPREAFLDWPHTLGALYRVRCNLFHGEKDVGSDNDNKIVLSALRVLSHFMTCGLNLP